MSEIPYILGHSPSEIRRLTLQASMLRPITTRLLREAGIEPGMRVLDIGCGTGDVAMLAAEMVGPSGAVVGIDRSAEVIAVARTRARAAGHSNIRFDVGAAENRPDPEPFDLAIGRYVLIYQSDPAEFIRAVASYVRPNGTIAFHEVAIYGTCHALPQVRLLEQAWSWVDAALRTVFTHPDAGGRMIEHFHNAGLKQPRMFCEVQVDGGPDSPFYPWVALCVRTVLPQIVKIGPTAAEVDIDTLEERLRDAVTATHAQAVLPMQFCGWVRR